MNLFFCGLKKKREKRKENITMGWAGRIILICFILNQNDDKHDDDDGKSVVGKIKWMSGIDEEEKKVERKIIVDVCVFCGAEKMK